MKRRLAVVLVAVLISTSCSADDAPSVEGVTVPDGFEVVEVFDGLSSPTQIGPGVDGSLLVAQLNGGENDQLGQVLVVDLDDRSTRVIYNDLDKPTGVALLGDEIYVMERDKLSVGSLDAEPLEVVVDELPTNGRSEGTLTVTPDQTLLFNTSGSMSDGEVVEDSGQLWELQPGGSPQVLATGFKNAYAHHVDDSGEVWVTEVSDGLFDGAPAADEVVVVTDGIDGGWPRCVGDQRPVVEFGGDQQSCANTARSLAVFEPGATPTSIAAAPWGDDQLLAALWNEGRVALLEVGGERPVQVETMLEGVDHPQHLLAVGESVLVTDPDAGRILSIRESD